MVGSNQSPGRHLRNRHRSRSSTCNPRRSNRTPHPTRTRRPVPCRLYRGSSHHYPKRTHHCGKSRSRITTFHTNIRNKMDRQRPTTPIRHGHPMRQHHDTQRRKDLSNRRRRRSSLGPQLPRQLPPPQHPESRHPRTTTRPRRACNPRHLPRLHPRRSPCSNLT